MPKTVVLLAVLMTSFAMVACDSDDHGSPAATETPTATAPESTATAERATFSDQFMLVSTRDHVSVCVDGAENYQITDEDVETIETALNNAFLVIGEVFSNAEKYRVSAETSLGCPAPTAMFGQAKNEEDDAFSQPVRTDVPSEHRVFIYLVPKETYSTAFDEDLFVIAPAEMFCPGSSHNCGSVTSELYVPADADGRILSEALLRVMGILPYAGLGDPVPETLEERDDRTVDSLRSQGVGKAAIDAFFERACELLASVCGPDEWDDFFLRPSPGTYYD